MRSSESIRTEIENVKADLKEKEEAAQYYLVEVHRKKARIASLEIELTYATKSQAAIAAD